MSEKKIGTALNRRSFLGRSAMLGAASVLAGGIFGPSAKADELPAADRGVANRAPTSGDVAILKFLAAAELVEDDLWSQYAELAINNKKYMKALKKIDPSLPSYTVQDRDNERSHGLFINAYLTSIGQTAVNLDPFRTLPSVTATGAEQKGRLTNLTNLNVDTSWYARYRSAGNPDFGDTFPQIVNIVNRPTIPTSDSIKGGDLQAIAHTALFHFATIEQGGASLYNSLMTKVSDLDVLNILTSIGPVEFYQFAAFHKSTERIFKLKSKDGSLTFPDLRKDPVAQDIFPEPCKFLRADLPLSSVLRPRNTATAGAVATATALVASNLFQGQPPAFLDAVVALATAADAAVRTLPVG